MELSLLILSILCLKIFGCFIVNLQFLTKYSVAGLSYFLGSSFSHPLLHYGIMWAVSGISGILI